jgi:hypothetical protein
MRKQIKAKRKQARRDKAARRMFECGQSVAERSDYFKLVQKGKVNHVAN